MLAHAFVQGPARHHLRELERPDPNAHKPKYLETLENLYFRAGELSTMIQRYLPKICITDTAELLGQPFSVRGGYTEAHRSYGLEEDDERLDGSSITLVLNPVIGLSGNDDGEGYENLPRALMRSCVLVGDWAKPSVGA